MIDNAYGELRNQFTLETGQLENEVVSMRDSTTESQRLSEELVVLKAELEEAKSVSIGIGDLPQIQNHPGRIYFEREW